MRQAPPRASNAAESRVTVCARIAATATASSAVSRSTALQPVDRRSCAFRAGGCASADCAPAPRRGRNDRCRSPAPGGRGSVAVPMPRQRTSRPSKASATPCAGGRRKRLPMRRARDRSGSAGRLVRLHFRRVDAGAERRKTERALAPRPTPPRSRRPCMPAMSRSVARRNPRPGDRSDTASRHIGLAGAVWPDQHDHLAVRLERRGAVVAEAGEAQTANAGGDHGQRLSHPRSSSAKAR